VQRRVTRRWRSAGAGEGGRGERGMAWWASSACWAGSGPDGQWVRERKKIEINFKFDFQF
jgi:hypothetical protein